jgi:hypothetical protein
MSVNPVVGHLIDAINSGDREAFLATLAPNATLSDDGRPRHLTDWIDREIFTVNGHFTVEKSEEDGLSMHVRFRNDTWGEMSTFWRFEVADDKITHIETGQA